MIKAIIFDCFGVLTRDSWLAFCDSLPPEANVPRARELNKAYDAGLISKEEFLKGVHEATGAYPEDVELIVDNETYKNTHLLELIKELKTRYKIGMLSNIATNWVRETFLTPQEQQLFDAMIFSFEVGTTKPDPQIYQIAAEKLDVEPNECIFIDDIERYCAAAQECGMQAIWYKDFKQTKQELEVLLASADH